jgi:hypothetical protein
MCSIHHRNEGGQRFGKTAHYELAGIPLSNDENQDLTRENRMNLSVDDEWEHQVASRSLKPRIPD